MITALIFAGGSGQRMNSRSKPKQFLEMHGKPIIIYTIEHFEYHNEIDEIVVVCLENWIDELNGFLKRFGITKVSKIVPGGETGHDSIYLGLKAIEPESDEDIVLIHDGVRPLINKQLITENIKAVRQFGSAITSEPARESVIRSKDGRRIDYVPKRDEMYIAKAPQSFYYKRILSLYEKAQGDNIKSVDSSSLCALYNEEIYMLKSTPNNIKITQPADFYIYRSLYEALEEQQIYGI